jgi:cytochrome P450
MSSVEPFPLYGQEFKRDPHAVYARLREQGPVHRVEFPSGVLGWLITGYDAAVETLSDSRLGKNHDLGNEAWRALAAIMPEPQHSLLQVHLLHQDPPVHTAMRRPVTDALAPRKLALARERMEQLAAMLVDALPPTGTVDLVATFAAPFSFAVLSEAIGLPDHLQRRFDRDWCKVVQPVGPRSPERATYLGRLHDLQSYISDVIEHKRRHPAEDLLGRLVAANGHGELGDAELSSLVFQLLVAGQEPVTNMIGMAVLALLQHPEQLRQLRRGDVALDTAVDELLRYEGSFELTTWRFFREPTEVHGVTIPAGDSVIVALAAANRDPARFPDPDTLDLTRSPNPHLAFGHGIHFCPGSALGRTEVQIAVNILFTRLPQLRLAVPPDELPWVQGVLTRGVERLSVTYTADTSTHCPLPTAHCPLPVT